MKYRLTLTPVDTEIGETPTVATGSTFTLAALCLLGALVDRYGIIAPEVFEGLASFQDGEEIEKEFSHFDFSCPEDQFTLKCEEIE